MKSIGYKVERVNIISNKFDEIRSELISNQQLIVDLLKNLIEKHAEDFSLTKSNSVRKLKFYSIVFRVKEANSFAEKLIRNNDYNFFDGNIEDIENINQPDLKNKIKELDDLIGIKILTDLNIDSINMFKLISSSRFIKDAQEKGIEINPDDLNAQPVKMKNGLNIFKLRCNYESWKFELQIKSKLESAWGDMEHSIFYKDYKLTPVRDLAQQSMNHIGKLLIEIDDFLQEIREANDNFSINSTAILFSNNFENTYSLKVSQLLNGINYNFKKIASLSYNIASTGFDILKGHDLNPNYLSFDCAKYAQYIKSRNEDFDLQIFEAIILSNIEGEISADTLEENLDTFFDLIKDSYKKAIVENNIIQDEELANNFIDFFFQTCISNECREFVLNTKNVYKHFENLKLLNESIEVLELEEEQINNLLAAYTIFSFNGNIQTYMESSDKDELLDNLEKAKSELSKIKVSDVSISENLNSLINILG